MGARQHDELDKNAGAVFVFERADEGTWFEAAKLLASDGQEEDHLGEALSIDGDTLVAGATGVDDLGSAAGAAYVFERFDGVWTETAKLLASDGQSGDAFGDQVAVEGDVLAIGAPGKSDLGPVSGAAYVFQRNASGAWEQTAKLLSPDGRGYDEFGYVSVDGDTLVVGSKRGRTAPGVNSGTADVFRLTPLTWRQGQELRREEVLRIPEGTPPGEYRVLGGVERMRLGLAGTGRSFRVVAGPSAQAPR